MEGFKNEIFASKVINGHPERFENIEIHGARETGEETSDGRKVTMIDDEDPHFTSVYLRRKSGTLSCIADFGAHAEALEYAKSLTTRYGWEIKDAPQLH